MQLNDQAQLNQCIFRDCVTVRIVQREEQSQGKCSTRKGKRQASSTTYPEDLSNDEGLNDFVDYVAEELFQSFPSEIQDLSYTSVQDNDILAEKYRPPLPSDTIDKLLLSVPPSVADSLEAYTFITSSDELSAFFAPVLDQYVGLATEPPLPNDPSIKATACELCNRDWIPLTYHHLIPRQVHGKAVKRKWHPEWRLNSVAWLCRACHSFVHKIGTNEELAQVYWSVPKLMEREDVQAFAQWIGRARWKPR